MTHNAPAFSEAVSKRFICDSMMQWAIATEVNDVWLLDHIMADDLIWFDDKGNQRNKQDALDEIVAESYIGSLKIDYLAVGFDGDTAYCAASETWASETWASETWASETGGSGGESGRLLAVTTWQFREGRWLLVRSEDAPVDTMLSNLDQPETHVAMLRLEADLWKQTGLIRGVEVMQRIENDSSAIEPAFQAHGYNASSKDGKTTHFVVTCDF